MYRIPPDIDSVFFGPNHCTVHLSLSETLLMSANFLAKGPFS